MSLKKRVLRGTKWVAFANIFKQVMQVVSLIIFARLLSPDDFGLFALLMIFVNFLIMFTDMGTASALIHIDKPSQKLLSSVFFLNIFIGVALALLLVLLSNGISLFFANPPLEVLLQIISINFIVVSLGVVQKARYEKALEFRELAMVESIAIFVGVTGGIISAIYGLGVYSLLIQTLLNSTLMVGLLWIISSWRPSLYFSIDDIKRIWGYTANLSAFNFVNYFARNSDNFLIGKFLNSSSLGVYNLAYSIMLYPIQNISRVLLRILFPAFSTIKDDNEKFKKIYLKSIFYIALISFPIMGGLIAIAPLLVEVLFGNKWEGLDSILMLLAPVGIIQSIGTTNGSIYMAKGNTRLLLRVGIFSTVVTIAFFIGGLFWGIEGVAISYLLSNIVLFYPIFRVSWSQIGLSVSEGLGVLLPILSLVSIMVGVVWGVGRWLDSMDIAPLLALILMIVVGKVIYISLITLRYGDPRRLIRELRS